MREDVSPQKADNLATYLGLPGLSLHEIEEISEKGSEASKDMRKRRNRLNSRETDDHRAKNTKEHRSRHDSDSSQRRLNTARDKNNKE